MSIFTTRKLEPHEVGMPIESLPEVRTQQPSNPKRLTKYVKRGGLAVMALMCYATVNGRYLTVDFKVVEGPKVVQVSWGEEVAAYQQPVAVVKAAETFAAPMPQPEFLSEADISPSIGDAEEDFLPSPPPLPPIEDKPSWMRKAMPKKPAPKVQPKPKKPAGVEEQLEAEFGIKPLEK